MRKSFLAMIAVLALAISCVLPFAATQAKADTALKNIDVYLLAGQSNAAGHTKVTGGADSNDVENLSLTSQSFSNVLMAGVCEPKLDGSNAYKHLTKASLSPVARGMGRNSNCIGPEYGMAKELSKRYTSDNQAIIFKYAAGGTTLRNDKTDNNYAAIGNWYPRSLQAENAPKADGGLYNGMIAAFESFTANMKANGYQPVVKGIAWHQGEDDRSDVESYRKIIQVFASDLREDMARITGLDCSGLFFAVGEISDTFSSLNAVASNEAFIKMQNEVVCAKAMMPAAAVEAGDLDINGINGIMGSDNAHFNTKDMITLGERFAQTFTKYDGKKYATVTANEGGAFSIDKNFFDSGESVTFTATPQKTHKITAFSVNGVDKLGELVNGSYTVAPTASVEFSVTFAARAKYSITSVSGGKFLANKTQREAYEGDTFYIVPSVPDGKVVDKITFNDEEMTYNAELDRYEWTNASCDGKVVITYKDAVAADDGGDATEKSGCGKESIALALSAFGALALAAFIIKK